ncbi:MAG TPA: LysM peptidoglycan-binding domain-containing protein [Thermoanaerobaculia bacterium]
MKRLALLLLFCAALSADDTIGWHVVKSGETLERITARYLGSSAAWRENWKLNPEVTNPHRLVPGQRIRVIIARTLPAQSALVQRVARHVEKKPEPQPWTAANPGDRLVERDGVHTFEASSAELKFDDDTLLTLTEKSLVFLRATRPVTPQRDRSAIEIVEGHADLEKPARAKRAHDIEIVVGGTTAKPNDPAAKARFRNAGKAAQVMSYRGATAVASAGAEVRVATGMGVSVPEGQKPPAPEKLLPAPKIEPRDVAVPLPVLSCSDSAKAESYTFEICRDPRCAEIVEREERHPARDWQPENALSAGSFFYRVTPRSASGLDGYPAVAPLVVRLGVSGEVFADARPAANVAVHLHRGEQRISSARTDANGRYGFASLVAGQYAVVVDSRTLHPVAWAEEISPNPGGLRAGVSDDASALASAEHVSRVAVDEKPIAGIDAAFSFGAVTHTGDTGQGSLRQFLENASHLRRDVPAMRYLGPRGTITLASPLPRIAVPVTIAGRPSADEIGSVERVGESEEPLRNPSRGDLTIDFHGAEVGIDAAADLVVRDVTLVGAATHVRAASRLTLENVVIGSLLGPRDAAGVEAAGDTTVRRTFITGMRRHGIVLKDGATVDAEDLEISDSGRGLVVTSPGSRVHRSLFLLNDTAITGPANVTETTFRGNRNP